MANSRFGLRSRTGLIRSYSEGFGATSYLLDLYQNAAAAYSLRLLRNAYTGFAIKVRRSSDNTEQDIGFINGGTLDENSLTTFCGVGNGFITTWYDQSGNSRNLTQSTAANQPQIVSSGEILTQNLKPTLKFDGLNDHLENADITTGNPKSIFICNKNNYLGGFEKVLFDSVTTNQALLYKAPDDKITLGFGNFVASTQSINTNFVLYSILHNGSTSNAYRNSTTQFYTNANWGTNAFNGFRLGAVRGSASLFWDGNTSEVVIYGSNQLSNRTEIENNINTHYGIY
jgi:hypothetical protein